MSICVCSICYAMLRGSGRCLLCPLYIKGEIRTTRRKRIQTPAKRIRFTPFAGTEGRDVGSQRFVGSFLKQDTSSPYRAEGRIVLPDLQWSRLWETLAVARMASFRLWVIRPKPSEMYMRGKDTSDRRIRSKEDWPKLEKFVD